MAALGVLFFQHIFAGFVEPETAQDRSPYKKELKCLFRHPMMKDFGG